MPVIVEDIYRLDHIDVFQRDPDAKLGHDLALIVFRILSRPLGPKLFDGIRRPARLAARLDQTDGPARTAPEDPTPLAILFTHVRLGSLESARFGEMTRSDGRRRTAR